MNERIALLEEGKHKEKPLRRYQMTVPEAKEADAEAEFTSSSGND
jgi:hypothetical protein